MQTAAEIGVILTKIDWAALIQSATSTGALIVGFLALRNWKKQDRAKAKLQFLDQIVEECHDVIQSMAPLVTHLKYARLMISNQTSSVGGATGLTKEGLVAFIKGDARKTYADRMGDTLAESKPKLARLRAMATKGLMFDFDGYDRCLDAVAALKKAHDRIEAFWATISIPSMNWNHPQVAATVEQVLQVDDASIRTEIETNNAKLIDFASAEYKILYR